MKNYHAHFTQADDSFPQAIMIAVDGISDTHAYARAWIKFMETKSYKDSPKGWELDLLEEDKA